MVVQCNLPRHFQFYYIVWVWVLCFLLLNDFPWKSHIRITKISLSSNFNSGALFKFINYLEFVSKWIFISTRKSREKKFRIFDCRQNAPHKDYFFFPLLLSNKYLDPWCSHFFCCYWIWNDSGSWKWFIRFRSY